MFYIYVKTSCERAMRVHVLWGVFGCLSTDSLRWEHIYNDPFIPLLCSTIHPSALLLWIINVTCSPDQWSGYYRVMDLGYLNQSPWGLDKPIMTLMIVWRYNLVAEEVVWQIGWCNSHSHQQNPPLSAAISFSASLLWVYRLHCRALLYRVTL